LNEKAETARRRAWYRLKHRLGSVGMGEVCLAEHRLLKQPCAIKLSRNEFVGDPTTLRRFQREVQVTAMLAHPNTVRIYDFLLSDHPPFEGRTPHHVKVARLEQQAPPLDVLGREIALDLEAVIRRRLEKEPADRFPDVISLVRHDLFCSNRDEFHSR